MTVEEASDRIAEDLLSLLGTARQRSDISVPDMATAGRIVARIRSLREARGEIPIGRKIGFSNKTMWPIYGVDRPIWNYLWDRTVLGVAEVEERLDLACLAEPRIEPEIVLHLAHAPEPGMDEPGLLRCIDRIAHGFEIVQSIFPGWKFTAAGSAAAFGLHGALVVGPWQDITSDRSGWAERLGTFAVSLRKDGRTVETGASRNVLEGGPVTALAHLVKAIGAGPGGVALQAGEIVTTGSLTDAYPVAEGETWETEFSGIALAGLRVRF